MRRHPLLDDPVFRRFFGEQFDAPTRRARSLGSGVIVSREGYILTNNHVVEGADEIEVALADGRTRAESARGRHRSRDRPRGAEDRHAEAAGDHLRRSPTRRAVGDVVLAIGNPFGVGQTVTMGIVSALGRSRLGINTFENFIQTDAAINPATRAARWSTRNGNLIGINTAIYSRTGGSSGIGFAIPVSTRASR